MPFLPSYMALKARSSQSRPPGREMTDRVSGKQQTASPAKIGFCIAATVYGLWGAMLLLSLRGL